MKRSAVRVISLRSWPAPAPSWPGGGVIPGRDDEVFLDDAGGLQPLRPLDRLLPRGEVPDAHLVETRFVDEVIGHQLAGQQLFGEAHGVVDVLERPGLDGVAQLRQGQLEPGRRRLVPDPGLSAASAEKEQEQEGRYRRLLHRSSGVVFAFSFHPREMSGLYH